MAAEAKPNTTTTTSNHNNDLTTVVKRRPMSAPKSGDVASIPRIVLDDQTDPSNAATTTTSGASAAANTGANVVTSFNGPGVRPVSSGGEIGGVGVGGGGGGRSDRDSPEPHPSYYTPHRCNSDIGLPTASMPNLTLAMTLGDSASGGGGGGGQGGGGGGLSGDKLGVYCSPRTTRRSVDLDLVGGTSSCLRDPAARAEYEWLEDKTASLRVLSAGSRVGSALSLNSVCTAHSVGLLSNDSDDDFQDSSIQGDGSSVSGGGGLGVLAAGVGGVLGPGGGVGGGGGSSSLQQSERAGQLRRLQSYPEEDKGSGGGGVGGPGGGGGDPGGGGGAPRTSHSLCNLKAVQAQTSTSSPSSPPNANASANATASSAKAQGQGRGQLTPEKLCLLPSDLDDPRDRALLPPGEASATTATADKKEGVRPRASGKEGTGGHEKSSAGHKANIVSYGKSSTSLREGRIRRWLQDMDKASD